jgi:hypothetical protein
MLRANFVRAFSVRTFSSERPIKAVFLTFSRPQSSGNKAKVNFPTLNLFMDSLMLLKE